MGTKRKLKERYFKYDGDVIWMDRKTQQEWSYGELSYYAKIAIISELERLRFSGDSPNKNKE